VPDDLSQDIRDRTFRLACDLARLALGMTGPPGVRRLADQLLRAGTSVGANLEEAKAASSRKDFVPCVQIALKEARETKYWLRVCAELRVGPDDLLKQLINEVDQVARILGAIVVKTKRRMVQRHAVFAFCILNLAFFISG
jgi:four helix bundle protein